MAERLAAIHNSPNDPRQFIYNGNGHDPRQKRVDPSRQFRLIAGIAHNRGGAEHEQSAQIGFALFRDLAKPDLAACAVLPGRKPNPGREMAARLERAGVDDGGDDRRRGDDADARNGLQQLRLRSTITASS